MQIKNINTNGKIRKIYIPDPYEKLLAVKLNYDINRELVKHDLYKNKVIHGFLPARSCVTNALQHINRRFTLSFDLKNFFESVTKDMVPEWTHCGFFDGAPRQGVPSSPAICNYAMLKVDTYILSVLSQRLASGAVYTRYADDLTFSFNNKGEKNTLLYIIPKCVEQFGLEINNRKTHFQSANYGRRIITGVGVDDKLYPTRRHKRKLRAAIHQKRKNKSRGLSEWCQVKLPGEYDGQTI